MKRILLSLLVIAAVICGCRSNYPIATKDLTLPHGEINLVRGKNLTMNICGECHYNKKEQSFVGNEMKELPGIMGTVYSANLTHGHIADKYSDQQLFYLIKTGISIEGHYIPWMIRPTIADQDLMDIIAYLRSDDEPVQQNNHTAGTTHLSWIARQGIKFLKPQPLLLNIPRPKDDPVSQGRYLVDQVGCFHCHSKSMFSLNYTNAEDSKGYMAGGMKFKVDGKKIYAPNLTPDAETGIGRLSNEEFRQAVQHGTMPDGKELQPPMPHFTHLTNEQTDAIFAYIKTLPPVHHKVKGH